MSLAGYIVFMPKRKDIISSREIEKSEVMKVPRIYADDVARAAEMCNAYGAGVISMSRALQDFGIDWADESIAMQREAAHAQLQNMWRAVHGSESRSYDLVNDSNPGAVPLIRVANGGQIDELMSRLSDIAMSWQGLDENESLSTNRETNNFSYQVMGPRRCGKTRAAVNLSINRNILVIVPNGNHRDHFMRTMREVLHERGLNPARYERDVNVETLSEIRQQPNVVERMRAQQTPSLVVFDELGPRDIPVSTIGNIVNVITRGGTRLVPFVFMGTPPVGFNQNLTFNFFGDSENTIFRNYDSEDDLPYTISVNATMRPVTINLPEPNSIGKTVVISRSDTNGDNLVRITGVTPHTESNATANIALLTNESISFVVDESRRWRLV
jgi:hypothetical protein